ncbi:amylo-alpha-1,6-glucosidase [Paenibacillus glycinis]|uniref:Mannosylglycerate hydrolase MGH1-like glycoside hydrolase domain-containing protein n=1 Tax=Paenibacillus glycinis TaxID=2697035 RepID=A0ABW9XN17_9BACL|nr:trehalase family glycosidase [Paenibacillus glycinis]NBD24017.1 hypothetical protein [Paenibacillus glycinis]
MKLDLAIMSYSRPGAWLEIVRRDGFYPGAEPGIYIGTMQSDANPREAFQIIPLGPGGQPEPFAVEATPAFVTLRTASGRLELVLDAEGNLRVRGTGAGFRLYRREPEDRGYKADYPFVCGPNRIQVNAFRSRKQYMITTLQGRSGIDAPWDGITCETMALDFAPDAAGGIAEIALEPFDTSWRERSYPRGFDECLAESEQSFRRWLARCPAEDAGYPGLRELAAYAQYVPIVSPSGLLTRTTMLISPGFNGVWSWDHCFNAMALARLQPELAWEQLVIPFDYQDEYGAIPDFVKNREIVWNYAKPPVHGWALLYMLERTEAIAARQLEDFYPKVAAWTEWWFAHRDYDGNGIPQYNHGNDSGWDNSTMFGVAGAVESPDLSAFLVIQMEALAEVAARIGRPAEALAWRQRAADFLDRMIAYFWNGGKFVAKRCADGATIDTASLLHWMPIILGARLPEAIRQRMAAELGPSGPFLTAWGLATERPDSPHYMSDGYWRGPIWAPAAFIAADGLRHAGERELAREIARRFVALCARSGMAENFDALTGAGRRDRFHTWPASVYQMFAVDFI